MEGVETTYAKWISENITKEAEKQFKKTLKQFVHHKLATTAFEFSLDETKYSYDDNENELTVDNEYTAKIEGEVDTGEEEEEDPEPPTTFSGQQTNTTTSTVDSGANTNTKTNSTMENTTTSTNISHGSTDKPKLFYNPGSCRFSEAAEKMLKDRKAWSKLELVDVKTGTVPQNVTSTPTIVHKGSRFVGIVQVEEWARDNGSSGGVPNVRG